MSTTPKKKPIFEQHREMSKKYGIKAKVKPGSKRDPESPAGNVVSVYLNDTEMERVNSVVGKSDKSEFIRQILMDAIEDIETEY